MTEPKTRNFLQQDWIRNLAEKAWHGDRIRDIESAIRQAVKREREKLIKIAEQWPCTCSEAYTDRDMIAPDCMRHQCADWYADEIRERNRTHDKPKGECTRWKDNIVAERIVGLGRQNWFYRKALKEILESEPVELEWYMENAPDVFDVARKALDKGGQNEPTRIPG